MSLVPISRQIARVQKRVALLEQFVERHPSGAASEIAEKRVELDEWRAVLATLIGYEARQRLSA